VDLARKRFPGLVHEARAFVEKAATIAIDDDAVRIDQHDGRRLPAARVDRFSVHAIPVARAPCTGFQCRDDAATIVVGGARRDRSQAFGPVAEVLAQQFAVALEAPAC
jgi:hypothetical protein